MAARLRKLTIKGFKSIANLDDFELGPLTVLIGPNGAGKSNLIAFFRMLGFLRSSTGRLQLYIGTQGGAGLLLHDGPSTTKEVSSELTIDTEAGENQYAFRLIQAAQDALIFEEEKYRFSRSSLPTTAQWRELGSGHKESALFSEAESGVTTAQVILALLNKIQVYQFHNTSFSARLRNKWTVIDNRYLREDAANIAPILYGLRESEPKYYRRIVDHIRLMLPFFDDFIFDNEHDHMLLKWNEIGTDMPFSASQASDGMLRIIALTTLLLQHPDTLPDLLILDEPELGLHPYATTIIGGLIGAVSHKTQVIIATQSADLLNCFDPREVVVVERKGRESVFQPLAPEKLKDWLERYSLAELWEKNVLGGRPE